MTPPDILRHAALPVSPWKNGAGRKADIASGPGWTLGYAWLDQDAPFSDYAGHDRTITLVEGPGFLLAGPAGAEILRVDAPCRPTGFDGGAALHCRLIGSACRVINVMTERSRARHGVEMIGESGRELAAPAPGETLFLVALAGAATLAMGGTVATLDRFDAVAITAACTLAPGPGRIAGLFALTPR